MRRKPGSVKGLEDLTRVRLSKHFFLREFLYSEIAALNGLPNIPDDPNLAIAAGTRLCEELLEPIQERFGRIGIRSGYRSQEVNALGNANNWSCASNESNRAAHCWDQRDARGHMGATVTIFVPSLLHLAEEEGGWRRLAWWIHDHLPYSELYFFPKLLAFNINWHEAPIRRIDSYVVPRGCLTKPGMENWAGDHRAWWAEL